ncbi:hypothetical protein SCLCIDRAFT_1222715 [Scleroderma citrinum Foug A]|uniref:Serine-threonine/tyrosine-protein kinase catalytic domain-containing protein n=1 Tax=Scleroderma citrinum Foug A TaxID=1036808 RepID=A0A0C3DAS8_9AGAM|nr:hypothetical protein SCLCIDRAFT_1222715 [Scleroderma citrinum Foug A]
MPRLITRIMSDTPDRPTEESTSSRLTDVWWALCTSCWNRTPTSRPSIAEIATRVGSASAT